MSKKPPSPSARLVKGNALTDAADLVRKTPHLPWADYLLPEDLAILKQLILPGSWYPAEFSDRLSRAVFRLVFQGNLDHLRAVGRGLAERMSQENPAMITPGRPLSTLEKYHALSTRFYSFALLRQEVKGPDQIAVHIDSGPDVEAAQIIIAYLSGAIERLVELSGGSNVRFNLTESVEHGVPHNTLEVRWDVAG